MPIGAGENPEIRWNNEDGTTLDAREMAEDVFGFNTKARIPYPGVLISSNSRIRQVPNPMTAGDDVWSKASVKWTAQERVLFGRRILLVMVLAIMQLDWAR